MIHVDSPSMVINDCRAAVNYVMDETKEVGAGKTMGEIVELIALRVDRIRRPIRNLILTGHGLPGSFQIGTGLNIHTMYPFSNLRGKVQKIWFRGCLVGRIPREKSACATGKYPLYCADGNRFLSEFAKLTQCKVIASTEMQSSCLTRYPRGILDAWEGLVVTYDRAGHIVKQTRYPFLYGFNADLTSASNPNGE